MSFGQYELDFLTGRPLCQITPRCQLLPLFWLRFSQRSDCVEIPQTNIGTRLSLPSAPSTGATSYDTTPQFLDPGLATMSTFTTLVPSSTLPLLSCTSIKLMMLIVNFMDKGIGNQSVTLSSGVSFLSIVGREISQYQSDVSGLGYRFELLDAVSLILDRQLSEAISIRYHSHHIFCKVILAFGDKLIPINGSSLYLRCGRRFRPRCLKGF